MKISRAKKKGAKKKINEHNRGETGELVLSVEVYVYVFFVAVSMPLSLFLSLSFMDVCWLFVLGYFFFFADFEWAPK